VWKDGEMGSENEEQETKSERTRGRKKVQLKENSMDKYIL